MYESFVERIQSGREFLLACHESETDPASVIDQLRRDPAFVAVVNTAKQLAYQKVQAALYDAAVAGGVAAIKEWSNIKAHEEEVAKLEHEQQLKRRLSFVDVESIPQKETMGRTKPEE